MGQNEIKGGDAGQVFDYGQVDGKMAEFLRKKESNMRVIISNAYTDLGRELYEAQQELSGSRYDGVFEQWYTYLRWKKRTVYNLIDRYSEVQKLHDGDIRDRFEELPVTLSYVISGKSSESTPAKAQAKSEVLSGDIDTLKKYRERIAELEREKDASDRRAEQAEVEVELLKDTIDSMELGGIEDDGEFTINSQTEFTGMALAFSSDVRALIRKFSYLRDYKVAVSKLDEQSSQEYLTAVEALKEFLNEVGRVVIMTDNANIIDMGVI